MILNKKYDEENQNQLNKIELNQVSQQQNKPKQVNQSIELKILYNADEKKNNKDDQVPLTPVTPINVLNETNIPDELILSPVKNDK